MRQPALPGRDLRRPPPPSTLQGDGSHAIPFTLVPHGRMSHVPEVCSRIATRMTGLVEAAQRSSWWWRWQDGWTARMLEMVVEPPWERWTTWWPWQD
jgi:hypothetical protein